MLTDAHVVCAWRRVTLGRRLASLLSIQLELRYIGSKRQAVTSRYIRWLIDMGGAHQHLGETYAYFRVSAWGRVTDQAYRST